ncbi:MAG: glycosyltransferase family 39 protein [Planctomycetales bacterium]|nr:glycosyltransferase family 39 protein [Planctomycetales bacterium]
MIIATMVLGRITAFSNSTLTTDESFTWRVLEYSEMEMIRRIAEDGHAPLYFILLKAYSSLAGKSLASLRAFSFLAYMLSTASHWGAFRALMQVSMGKEKEGESRWDLILLMAILTFNPLQVFVAANARMYSLGMLFVSLSTWTYLRALEDSGKNAIWLWLLWGILTGAGMLTHHFVGFIAAGQVLATLWLMTRSEVHTRNRRAQLAPLTLGCLSAIAVYSPWLSVIGDQFAEVNRQFWIGPLTFDGVAGSFSSWLTGMGAGEWQIYAAMLANAAALWCLALGIRYRPIETVPFACHALMPWILCLSISLASGRPLLQDRYLVFGQASAFTAICLGWGALNSIGWRVVIGCVLVGSHFVGLVSGSIPRQLKVDPFAQCIDAVLAHDDGKTSKTIFVRWPADVNRARYFLDRAKRNDFQVKLLANPFRIGHVGHIAALASQEIYWSPFPQLTELTSGAWVIYDEPGNSALGSLGAVEIIAEYEIPNTNSAGGKAILVRRSRESIVPVP